MSWLQTKSLNSEGKTGSNHGGPCHSLMAFMPRCTSRGCPGEGDPREEGSRLEGHQAACSPGLLCCFGLRKAPVLDFPLPWTLEGLFKRWDHSPHQLWGFHRSWQGKGRREGWFRLWNASELSGRSHQGVLECYLGGMLEVQEVLLWCSSISFKILYDADWLKKKKGKIFKSEVSGLD